MADEAAPDQAWPPGTGEMARLIRARDWAATPLGSPEGWPRGLTAVVELMLAMPQIASIAVGPERLLLYNDLAARQYGPRHPHALGQPIADTFADQWAPIAGFYDQVFAGEGVHVPAQPVDSAGTGTPEVYDASLAPVRGGDGRVVAAFVTFVAAGDRVLAEAALRESEERQAFLLRLSDALRPLVDARKIKATAAAAVGRHLDIASAGYAEVEASGLAAVISDEYNDGRIPSLRARYVLADFSSVTEPMKRGETIRFADLDDDGVSPDTRASFSAINVRAAVGAPLIKDGEMVAYLFVAHPEPRVWTAADLDLIGEVAERTWAAVERAKVEAALRTSEEKYRTLFDTIDEAVTTLEVIFDENEKVVDWRMLETNPATTKMTGWSSETVGKLASEYIPGGIEPFWFEAAERVIATGEPWRFEHPIAGLNDNWYEMYVARIGGAASRQIVAVYTDVVEQPLSQRPWGLGGLSCQASTMHA